MSPLRAPRVEDAPVIAVLASRYTPEPVPPSRLLTAWLEPESWRLAVAGQEPVGFAICHVHATKAALGWIAALGVRREWRRSGLGRVLLLEAFRLFWRRGFARVGLGVDADSLTGANRLYEQAGTHVTDRFDVYVKELA